MICIKHSIDFTDEQWMPIRHKDIKNIYEVSSYGKIRNCNTGKILKQYKCHAKYDHLSVSLMKKSSKKKKLKSSDKRKTVSVHVLVAEAFIDNPENKPIVHHIDGNPTNNHYNNLMWVTSSEHQVLTYQLEQRDRKFGEKSNNSKYTNEQYIELARLLNENNNSIKQLSKLTGISVASIREFIHGNVVFPEARKKYDISNYDKYQTISESKMELAFKLASENKFSVIEISRLSGVKPTTVSNIVNKSVSTKWQYLYGKYPIQQSANSKEIVVIDKSTTNKVINLLKKNMEPKTVISLLDLPKNKSIYGKVYRISRRLLIDNK